MSKKNRRKIRKALATMLAALLLVVVSVGATIAYLTDDDSVVNTFTVGNVAIKLDEAKVDANGKAIEGEDRVQANSYKVYPGGTYDKDPTVTVLAKSEESYVYMGVKASDIEKLKNAFPNDVAGDVFLLQNFVNWTEDSKWDFVEFDTDSETYIFKYEDTVCTLETEDKAAANLELEPLFTTITLPGDLDNDHLAELQDLKIKIAAFAIQTNNVSTATAQSEAEKVFATLFA